MRPHKFPVKTVVALLLGIVATAYLCSEFRTPWRGYPKELTRPYQSAETRTVRSVYFSADIPGTLVCPDPSSLHDLLFDYEQYRVRRHFEPHGDLMGRTQPPSMPTNLFPRPSAHDCAIVPPNTPMQLSTGHGAPQVIVTMANGVKIHGFTLLEMIQTRQPDQLTARPTAQTSAP